VSGPETAALLGAMRGATRLTAALIHGGMSFVRRRIPTAAFMGSDARGSAAVPDPHRSRSAKQLEQMIGASSSAAMKPSR